MAYLGITVKKSRSCIAFLSKQLLAEQPFIRNCRSLFSSSISCQQSVKRAEHEAPIPLEPAASVPARPKLKTFFKPQYDGDPGQNLRLPKVVDNHLFIPFYHYPYITAVRACTKLKMLQTGLTFVMVPIATIMFAKGSLSLASLITAAGVNMFAIGALFAFSQLFKRWIGRMYIDQTKRYVLISHLDFWGNRKDEILRIEDVVPLDNAGENTMDIYVRFDRLDYPKEFFYGNLSAGGILEPEVFKDVFGGLPVLKPRPIGPNEVKS